MRNCQLALTGARVVDPESGLDGVRTVGISRGTIVAVSAGPVPADTTVDVSGQVLAPGFIDLHSHAQSRTGMRLQALDGVTTALELEAGALPVRDRYRRSIEEGRPINFGFSASWALARLHLFDGVPLSATESILSGHQGKAGLAGAGRPGRPGQAAGPGRGERGRRRGGHRRAARLRAGDQPRRVLPGGLAGQPAGCAGVHARPVRGRRG